MPDWRDELGPDWKGQKPYDPGQYPVSDFLMPMAVDPGGQVPLEAIINPQLLSAVGERTLGAIKSLAGARKGSKVPTPFGKLLSYLEHPLTREASSTELLNKTIPERLETLHPLKLGMRGDVNLSPKSLKEIKGATKPNDFTLAPIEGGGGKEKVLDEAAGYYGPAGKRDPYVSRLYKRYEKPMTEFEPDPEAIHPDTLKFFEQRYANTPTSRSTDSSPRPWGVERYSPEHQYSETELLQALGGNDMLRNHYGELTKTIDDIEKMMANKTGYPNPDMYNDLLQRREALRQKLYPEQHFSIAPGGKQGGGGEE